MASVLSRFSFATKAEKPLKQQLTQKNVFAVLFLNFAFSAFCN